MANAKLSVSDLMRFLPDFRDSLNIREIAFSLLAKSVIRLDQCASLTSGRASEEKVERLVMLLQALEMSTSKPSGVHYFIESLRETGENKNIKGHTDLFSKILITYPTLVFDDDQANDQDDDDYHFVVVKAASLKPPAPHASSDSQVNKPGRDDHYQNGKDATNKECSANLLLPPRPPASTLHNKPPPPLPVPLHTDEMEGDLCGTLPFPSLPHRTNVMEEEIYDDANGAFQPQPPLLQSSLRNKFPLLPPLLKNQKEKKLCSDSASNIAPPPHPPGETSNRPLPFLTREHEKDDDEETYGGRDVQPAQSIYPFAAKGLTKADNDVAVYEDWNEEITKNDADEYEDLPTNMAENKQEGLNMDKPPLLNQPSPDSNVKEKEEETEEEEDEEEDAYQEFGSVIKKLTSDHQEEPPEENNQNGTAVEADSNVEEKEEETEEEEEQDTYQQLSSVIKKLTSDHQEEPPEENDKNGTSSEGEDYHPTTDEEGGHSKSDCPDHADVNNKSYSHENILNDNKVTFIPMSSLRPTSSPKPSSIPGGFDVHNGFNVTTEVSNKDNDVIERSHDLSASESSTLSELLQSFVAERESFTKTAEAQRSQLKNDLIKTHELEMKDLHLKYKSKVKKLQLKQLEEGLATKAVIEKLQSELNGVYKQNSKLANYVKKSCKREEKFNQVVTMLQDTVSNLQSELNKVRQEVVELRKRETELVTSLESTKEKLKKYEAV